MLEKNWIYIRTDVLSVGPDLDLNFLKTGLSRQTTSKERINDPLTLEKIVS